MREKRESGKEIEYFIQLLENGKLVEDMPWLKHGELNKQIFILNQNDNKEIKMHEPTRKNRMKIKQQQTMLTHFYEQGKKKCEDATKQRKLNTRDLKSGAHKILECVSNEKDQVP